MAFVTCPVCGRTDVDTFGRCVLCGTPFEEEKVMSEKMKVLIVGRHTPDLGAEAEKFEVAGNEAPTFGPTGAEAEAQLEELFAKASELGATAILLQNTPGVLASALLKQQMKAGGQLPFRVGIVISVPGERQAGLVKLGTFQSEDPDSAFSVLGKKAAQKAAEFVQFANGRAKVEVEGNVLSVTVDPVTPFVFSHIEWL